MEQVKNDDEQQIFMEEEMMNCELHIYETEDQRIEVRLDIEHETLWLSQAQLAQLFGKDVRTINEHIKNIFAEQELIESESTIRNFRIVRQEGQRQVNRSIDHYSLDVIISVGYRVNSKTGTRFRIWATQRLKDYLVKGYALNRQRFAQNAAALRQALKLIEKTAQSSELDVNAGQGLVEIVSRYTQTFYGCNSTMKACWIRPKGRQAVFYPLMSRP